MYITGPHGYSLDSFHGLDYLEIRESELVQDLIQRGLEATDAINDYSVGDVLEMIGQSKAQCWGAFMNNSLVGIVITKILVYPKRKLLQFFLVAGECFEDWFCQGWEILTGFALAKGCSALRGTGRVGWLKKLKIKGYSTWSIEL